MRLYLRILFVSFLLPLAASSQITEQISEKVTLSVNTNIETYFIAERLAVQHIGNYVFSDKKIQYAHQPLVYFSQKEFQQWKDSPVVLRIAELLKQLRDILHDNAQTLEYLLYKNPLPDTGFRWPLPSDLPLFNESTYPGAKNLAIELTDSLASFYKQAKVGAFLKNNARYYKGALNEARKHINSKSIPYMEKWYGEQFAGYELYVMPGMPITPGDDNYRAFGPTLTSPKGKVSAMVFSSSVQIPLQKSLKDYNHFGFDNAAVTKFLTVHEIGHSFVNPHMNAMDEEIAKDTALFTPALAGALADSYIDSWKNCIIEHLVRLGEIRVANAVGDSAEVVRLRKLHINEFKFALLPVLEKKIEEYERHRSTYSSFNEFLPQIFSMLHGLKPQDVDAMLTRIK